MSSNENRLEDIHAMMQKAHNSVRIEPHTFLLIGPAVAAIMMLAIWVIQQNLIPDLWIRVLVLNAINAIVIGAVLLLDRKLTRKARISRGETVSIVQQRLSRFLWVLVIFVFAIDFLVAKFGWWRATYFTATSVLGLYMIVTGLFSRQPLLISGLLVLASSFIAMMFGPAWASRALAISVFGIGMPLFGWLVSHNEGISLPRFAVFAAVWLAGVILPASAVLGWQRSVDTPKGDVISLAQFMESGVRDDNIVRIVKIPAGTKVPLDLNIAANIVEQPGKTKIFVTTSQTILLAVRGSTPDGRMKVGKRDWQGPNNHRVQYFVTRAQNRLNPEFGLKAIINLKAVF